MPHLETNDAPILEEGFPHGHDLRSRLSPHLIDFLQTMNAELDSPVMTESVVAN
jgi:hypothetical protein